MEEVLRAIYLKNQFKFTQQPAQTLNTINHDNLILQMFHHRKRYSQGQKSTSPSLMNKTIDATTISTPASTFRHHYQKNKAQKNENRITQSKQFQSIDYSANKNQTIKLPLIKQTKLKNTVINRRKLNKFRIAGKAVLFMIKLMKLTKNNFIEQKEQLLRISRKIPQSVNRLIHSYYEPLLEEQIKYYQSLLSIKLQNPSIDLSHEIVSMLLFMSKKLAQSTIFKDLFYFFQKVSLEGCFVPSQFLSEFEIKRLQFDQKYGMLMNMTPYQTRMIVGLSLGVKIFCANILYRPWTMKCIKLDIVKNYSKLQSIIHDAGSLFYFLLMNQFQIIHPIYVEISQLRTLKNFNIQPMQIINPYPAQISLKISKKSQVNSQQLIKNQSRYFYEKMVRQDADRMNQIRKNLEKWIKRIAGSLKKDHINTLKNESISPNKNVSINKNHSKAKRHQ